MPPAVPGTTLHIVLQIAGDRLLALRFLRESKLLSAIAQKGIHLRIALKALCHAAQLAFDLAARLGIIPTVKLPALLLQLLPAINEPLGPDGGIGQRRVFALHAVDNAGNTLPAGKPGQPA